MEALVPQSTKSAAQEKELDDIRKEIDRIKALPISVLVGDFTETIDFQDICNKMLPSRTPHQCQVFWYNQLHPHLNKGEWTEEEDKKLLELVQKNTGSGNWDRIACELCSNRTPVQCLERYQRNLKKDFCKSKWNPEDDKILLEAVKMCGLRTWEKVASFLDGRTGAQCLHRYTKTLDPEIRKGKWAKEEDDLVRKGIEIYGTKWVKFRNLLPHRSDSQIRERWQDVLDPKLRKSPWTAAEDEKLLRIVEEQSVGLRNWSAIAKLMSGRTDNRCRRRWFVLTRNDPKTKDHFEKQKIAKKKLVNNPSRRRVDKSSIGPEDFQPLDSSNTEIDASISQSRDSDAAKSDLDAGVEDKADCGDEAASNRTRKAKEILRRRGKVEKKASRSKSKARETQKISETKKSLKSPRRVSVSTPEKWQMKTRSRAKSLRKKQAKKIHHSPAIAKAPRKPSAQKNKASSTAVKPKKPKVTAPSPTVVSQAAALPSATPMSAYLTQFSVLLQAFRVDVSGALKKVNSPGEETATSQRSSISSPPTSSACLLTPGAPPAVSQPVRTGDSNINHQVGPMDDKNTSIATKAGQISPTPDGHNNHQVCKVVDETVTHNNTENPVVLPRNTRSHSILPPASLTKSSTSVDTTDSRSISTSAPDELSTSSEASSERIIRKRNQTNALTTIRRKRKKASNSENKEAVENTEEDPVDKTEKVDCGPILNDVATSFTSQKERSGDDENGARCRKPRKRKQNDIKSRSQAKRKRTLNVCGGKPQGESIDKNSEEEAASDTEKLETLPCSHPARPENRQLEAAMDNHTSADDISQRTTASNADKTNQRTSSDPVPTVLKNPYLSVKRVVSVDHDSGVPRVPSIPSLPPSAATLGAFKKLLMLRKDLQSQADLLNEVHAASSRESVPPRNATPHNPQNDRLQLVSKTTEPAGNEWFRNSIPYQQLLNRFKGLFMWPGFLSIVNPSSVKPINAVEQSPGPSKTTSRKTKTKHGLVEQQTKK